MGHIVSLPQVDELEEISLSDGVDSSYEILTIVNSVESKGSNHSCECECDVKSVT